jgi:hypothetical protein
MQKASSGLLIAIVDCVAIAIIVTFATLLVLSVPSTNASDRGEIAGSDFLSFYAAGRLALTGHPEDAYQRLKHGPMQQTIARETKGGPVTGYFCFSCPPT